MKFENTEISGFSTAFRGMRNPLNSWNRSDSYFGLSNTQADVFGWEVAEKWAEADRKIDYDNDEDYNKLAEWHKWLVDKGTLTINTDDEKIINVAYLGPNDLNLAQRLIKSGTEHAKFLRQIYVGVDITGPLFWWKELDTYKISTTANSTSTMHKLASTPIAMDCFEMDDFSPIGRGNNKTWELIVSICEDLRQKYNETKDIRYWKELIRILPESWLQTRTWTANYAILRNIYSQRKNHKLSEWHSFCKWIQTLPYAAELITMDIDN